VIDAALPAHCPRAGCCPDDVRGRDKAMHVLVTGGAGFIGSHLVDSLLTDGHHVTVLDNFDPFYDRAIKEANIEPQRRDSAWRLVEADIRDASRLREMLIDDYDCIVHLAARAGVRPSIADPIGYQHVNVEGTQNILEFARERGIKQFVFASSSSVYGINPHVPWSEDDHVLQPISPYASTKVSGELLGHVYSELFGIRFIALRFFTVYGPRQRPDLAIHKFARMISQGEPIPVFGDGNSRRDYTYVDDIVAGIRQAIDYDATPYEVINLGNNQTVSLLDMIRGLQFALGRTAELQWLPPQPGDVPQTWANIEKAQALLGYSPTTTYLDGVRHFAGWLPSERALTHQ
jgi:UDP-glucuronate 4-epimerase